MRIDHIGVVVPDIKQGIKEYERIGYVGRSPVVDIPHRGIQVVFLSVSGPCAGPDIELIQIMKEGVQLPTMHVAFRGIFNSEWNQIDELACKLIQEGKGSWEPIPELNVKVLFFTGPGGELLELVRYKEGGCEQETI